MKKNTKKLTLKRETLVNLGNVVGGFTSIRSADVCASDLCHPGDGGTASFTCTSAGVCSGGCETGGACTGNSCSNINC